METAQVAQQESVQLGRRRRRAIPVVDARFQWKYTLVITALGVGITAVMGAFLYNAHTDNTRLLDLDGNSLLQEQVTRGDKIFLLYLIALVVVMAVALALWGLIVTHRVSGPLFVLERYLNELANGRYPDVRPLRKRDELRGFFGAFEDAVAGLKARDTAALDAVNKALVEARMAITGDAQAGLKEAVRALEKQREVLAVSLGGERGP